MSITVQRVREGFQIKMPNGATLQLPPDATDEDISEVISSYESMSSSPKAGTPQGDFPWSVGNVLGAVTDPIKAMGAGAAQEAVAGGKAIWEAMLGRDVNPVIQETREKWSPIVQPQTSGGKVAMQGIQSGINTAFGPEGLDWIGTGESMGEQAFELTGSPAIAAAYRTLPDALTAAAGFSTARTLEGMVRLKNTDGTPTPELEAILASQGLSFPALSAEVRANLPAVIPRSALEGKPTLSGKEVVGKELKAGGTQEGLARFQEGLFGPKKDPIAMQGIDLGMDEGVIQMIKTSDPTTQFNMLRILNEHQAKTMNRGAGNDPYAVVGSALESRVNFLDRKAREASARLDATVKGRLTGQFVDTSAIDELFRTELDKLGIRPAYRDPDTGEARFFNPDGKAKVDFSTSNIAKDAASQKMIQDAIELVANRRVGDAADLHLLKKQLDGLIDWNKASTLGSIPPTGRNFVKSLRWTANDILRTVDADYAKANDTLSLILDAKGDLYDSLVKSARTLAQDGEWAAAGNDLRKLFSNYGKGYEQIAALRGIDDAVNKLMAESTGKDVVPAGTVTGAADTPKIDQSSLYNMGEVILELDRLVGSTKRGNFASQVSAGLEPTKRALENQRALIYEKLYQKATEPFRIDPAMAERQRKLDVYRIMQELIRERGAK